MTQQRLTQCPHCKASFKVSEEQLNAANGRVRCGACMNIFDAIAYSLSTPDGNVTSSNSETNTSSEGVSPDKHSDTVDLEQEILEEEMFADNPEEDEQEAGYSGGQKLSDELSTSFLELDEDDNSDPYSTSFKTIEEDFVSNEAVDESWTKDILDNLDESNSKKEPTISDPDPIPQNLNTQAPHNEHEELSFPGDSSGTHYEKIDFQYQQDPTPSDRHWFITFSFFFVNVILLLVLLAQASWYHYEKLAKYPQLAKIYEMACEQLQCTLPKLEDISKIKSQNLVVRSHPTARKSLIIDTVIINNAAFDQDFPDIALYFSDINKKVIAQRLVSPTEYLSGDLLNWPKMPSEQPIHISLEILDPGKSAVNYNLEFFPHTSVK